MFKKGCRYRHINSQDLDIFVLAIRDVNPERVVMDINYLTKKTGELQYTGKGQCQHKDKVRILTKHFDNWTKVSGNERKVKR